jgi:trans-AT polyketide synthase/acyltransferase/oxidoreductase domain-containing protein
MKQRVVFMFSGQGAQYYQMGKELFTQHPVFREWMLEIDAMIYRQSGLSIVDKIYDAGKRKTDRFDRTLYSHPAIFMLEYALARVLMASGIEPDYVMGASMGEFASVAVAQVMSLEAIVESLLHQARSLEDYCNRGSMIAILQSPDFYYANPVISANSELVSVNYHSHFVVAGDADRLARVVDFLKAQKAVYQVLPVAFGFHSGSIDPAKPAISGFGITGSRGKPSYPLISCRSGGRLAEVSATYFWEVIREPIRFREAIGELERDPGNIYLDLGPAGTLANFAKQNLANGSASICRAIVTPFGLDCKNLKAVEELLQKPINHISK